MSVVLDDDPKSSMTHLWRILLATKMLLSWTRQNDNVAHLIFVAGLIFPQMSETCLLCGLLHQNWVETQTGNRWRTKPANFRGAHYHCFEWTSLPAWICSEWLWVMCKARFLEHFSWYFETDVFSRYEINLTNAVLFANLTLDGLPQLAPGRLFTTRMPRNIVEDPSERADFVEKCKVNDLRVSEQVFEWVVLKLSGYAFI